MTLEELFQRLSYGELSNLAAAVEATGTILKEYQPKVVVYANEAIKRLYTRFPLNENDTIITLVKGTKEYPLPEGALQVMEVYDPYGNIVPLNSKNDRRSVFSKGPTLIVPTVPDGATTLQVIYRAGPALLTIDPANIDLTQEIDIPSILDDALVAYIAYKAYSDINTQESVGIAMQHQLRYETLCNELTSSGFFAENPDTGTKFRERGWV